MEKNLGHATAYGYAKSKGYSGTEEEFAQLMADYASVGQSAAQSAEQAAASATSASGSATTASQAAQTATDKASEAVTAAGTATTKASEASQSASTASAAATSASTSAQTATTAAATATTKASEASESAATATAAKTDAETARDAAAQSASEAAESARTLTIDATLTQSGQAADAKVVGDEFSQIKEDLKALDDHVRYENENIIAENDIQTTSGVKIDSENSSFTVSIDNGASFRFRVNGTNIVNKFALYYVGSTSGRFAINLSPNTNYEFTAPATITGLYIYTSATDVIGSGTLKLVVANVTFNNESVDKKIADLEAESDELLVLRGDKWQLDRDSFTTICVHHDNFSRTMTGWEIGMNAGGTDEGNSYDWVTPNTYDDGLRVNNGATFESGTRTYSFSLRKIKESVSDNFMFETNAPIIDYPVLFGFNVTDIANFKRLEIRKNNSGYRMFMNDIVNGVSQTPSVFDVSVTGVIGKVISVYCVRGVMYIYLDDTFLCSAFVGALGNYVYLASNKSYNTHFDFINVFNVVSKTAWNPNRILDSGISGIPLKTISANEGNYELQNTITRWSNYADHMTLHSDDPLIHNGRRCEISIGKMNDYNGNLRHFIISFDVLFPSEYVDAEQGDLFIQMHDRDGTYRGTVPFALYIKNNVINVNTSSTYEPKADNTTVIIDLYRFDFAEVELGKWHHFEIECKERYEARQNPFLRITIDGITQFEYRKANCYNDLLGASPQYGIYKNNWGTGVTEFQRYFDNFKIEYC